MKIADKKWKLILLGVVVGLLTMLLAMKGNPKNMAICVACFIRDIAGGVKMHTAPVVQYFRPEIAGFVVGSFLIAASTKEYRATGGSSPMIRFLLGFMMMIGALVFLGCPLRMLIRMSAGDANAWVGLIGFAGGIATGSFFLKKGFSLGRAHAVNATNGMVLPIALVFLLCLSMAVPTLFAFSEKGPGSMHAPVLLAFAAAVIIGIVAQKSRMCFAGSLRDIFLMKDFGLISILGGLFVVMLIFNIATGNFKFSFTGQPVAHAQHLWNILGLYVVGFAAVLAGGCPMRQLILAGQGSTDSAVTFLGLLIGAAFAHNFGLAGAAANPDEGVAGGPATAGKVAVILCICVLFLIAVTNRRKATAEQAA